MRFWKNWVIHRRIEIHDGGGGVMLNGGKQCVMIPDEIRSDA